MKVDEGTRERQQRRRGCGCAACVPAGGADAARDCDDPRSIVTPATTDFCGDGLANNCDGLGAHATTGPGGYLDDVWIYDNAAKSWETRDKLVSVYPDPGLPYGERHRTRSQIHWPDSRCGHASVLHGDYLCTFGG